MRFFPVILTNVRFSVFINYYKAVLSTSSTYGTKTQSSTTGGACWPGRRGAIVAWRPVISTPPHEHTSRSRSKVTGTPETKPQLHQTPFKLLH